MTSYSSYICEYCHNEFMTQVRPRNKPQPRFCSLRCSADSRRGLPSKNNHQLSRICENCGKTYWLPKYRYAESTACSSSCKHALHGVRVAKHMMSHDKVYTAWSNMKQRCTNPKKPEWKNYGGRGIGVCKEWLESFQAFYDYIGDVPDGLTLDRVDNDGNYEPGNVRWADRVTQSYNSRRWSK